MSLYSFYTNVITQMSGVILYPDIFDLFPKPLSMGFATQIIGRRPPLSGNPTALPPEEKDCCPFYGSF